MDDEINTLRTTIATSKTQEKQLRLTLSTLSNTLSTTELKYKIEMLEKEKLEIERRLEALRKEAGDAGVKPVDLAEKESVEKEWKVWKRNVQVRKGFVKELWGIVSEVLPEGVESREELWVSRSFAVWIHEGSFVMTC
jgi:hypothetical protein